MSKKSPIKFETINFDYDEFRQIIERSKKLIRKGYFTGINFLQSNSALPQSSIIIHFLHDSKKHLEGIESYINVNHLVVPRFTYYMLKPEYFKKPNFREEYKHAIFFDSDFKTISIDDSIRNPHGVTISNKELDLIIPITDTGILREIIKNMKEADSGGIEPWIDPVIIVKTGVPMKTLEQFVDKHFVSITREKEEFYSVLTDRKRADALERYFNNLCKRTQIGKLRRSDVVFYPSQINIEFANYLSNIQNQL